MNTDSILKSSLHTIRILKEKLESKENVAVQEPIAVISMACRFPGKCITPEAFWKLLEEKGDAVIEVPKGRWDKKAENADIINAGFLQEDISEFDAKFFRISPIEAAEMDPQQRILLELSWEALERACQNPDKLKGSNTGVFIGIIGSEYAVLPRDPEKVNMYSGTGSMTCIASGRISHILGLNGPSISIDTACSSSLVSVHHACESLKRNECDMALAGGVNIMLMPETFWGLSIMGALEKDGRCKPFDANGQGYGRGEGCGIIVLKRLSDAQRDGDPILALIRGGNVNHDGASSGLTVPNGNAQKKLIVKALADTDTKPDEVGYLEAHGTGTSLGDPIEIGAMTEVFGTKTRKSPLMIGSVKGNIGHLEGSAGIASLIKAVLCIQNKKIPASINCKKPNPRIRFDKIPAFVPTSTVDWDTDKQAPRIAGVSSFGFSGTNAHLILSDPPAAKTFQKQPQRPCSIMKLSAKSKTALKHIAAEYKEYLDNNRKLDIEDICYTANTCRADFSHRAAFVGKDAEAIKNLLEKFISDQEDKNIFYGKKEEDARCKAALFFTDDFKSLDTVSWAYDNITVFQNEIKNCSDIFKPLIETSIEECISQKQYEIQRNLTVKNACLFTIQYAFFKLWKSLGIVPFAVFGQKTGIYAAAAAAGVISPTIAASHILGRQNDISSTEYKAPVCRFLSGKGLFLKNKDIAYLLKGQEASSLEADYDKIENSLKEQGCDFFIKIDTQHLKWETLLKETADFYCKGFEIDWENLADGRYYKKLLLPVYPFEKKHYWITPPNPAAAKKVLETAGRPLEGICKRLPQDKIAYEYRLSIENLPDLGAVHGTIHVGYWQEMLDSALKNFFKTDIYLVKNMEFIAAAIVKKEEAKDIYLSLIQDQEKDRADFVFYTKDQSDIQWNLNVKGTAGLNEKISLPDLQPANTIKQRCSENYSADIFYQMMTSRGIELGDEVKIIDKVWRKDNEALASLKVSSDCKSDYKIGFYPGVLDACAQLFHAALPDSVQNDIRYMVVKWEDFTFTDTKKYKDLWCYVTIDQNKDYRDSISGAFTLLNENSEIICFARKNVMKGISDEMVQAMKPAEDTQQNLDTSLIDKLLNASLDEKNTLLKDYFLNTMAEVFKVASSELDPKEPLREMGIDSMIGLRFKTVIASKIGIDIPIEDLIAGHSIEKLSQKAAKLMSDKMGKILEKEEKQPKHTYRAIWFYNRKPRPQANLRLFCFPYGGGGASIFKKWQDKLPEYIEVCPIQIPGLENRIKETPIDNIQDMTDTLEKIITPETDKPYAIYGHSIGALTGFRLAHRLWEKGLAPIHLFVGGFTSPIIFNTLFKKILNFFDMEGIKKIPESKELTEPLLKKLSLFFSSIFPISAGYDDKELFKAMLPASMAGYRMLESYFCKKQPDEQTFDVPITACHGKYDNVVTLDENKAWKELTVGEFNCRVFNGDHFFMHEDQCLDELINTIINNLKRD